MFITVSAGGTVNKGGSIIINARHVVIAFRDDAYPGGPATCIVTDAPVSTGGTLKVWTPDPVDHVESALAAAIRERKA